MAKWGEGDPRWIVEERPDSTNVNNWHWTEKNCFPWVDNYLKDQVIQLKSSENEGKPFVNVISIEVEGEATLGNRKGKLYYIYELTVTVKWKGENEGGKEVEGKIKVTDVTQDDDISDYGFKLTCENETAESKSVKALAQNKILPDLKKVLERLKVDIRTEHEKNVLLPTAKPASGSSTPTPAGGEKVSAPQGSAAPAEQKSAPKSKEDVKTIKMTVELLASARDIFDALLEPQRVQIWTRSKVQISKQPGSQFSLFDGNITGEIVSVVQDKEIVQKWRLKDWPQGHFSTVTMTLEQGSNSTELSLVQSGVPSEHSDSTTANWSKFFWNQLKGVFGWGVLD